MLNYVGGDLFESPAQTLVNTVNTVGVMGKGVAKRFREIFPEMFREYQLLCEERELRIGSLHFYRANHKNVLNFPTKKHWRNSSKVEWIEQGLDAFIDMYEESGITSIAFPPLGCGNGELNFERQVKPVMEEYLSNISIPVYVHLYDVDDPVPEHRTQKETERWLRSRPGDLSFFEVWEDIEDILDRKEVFSTLTKSNPFTAKIEKYNSDDGNKRIKLEASNHEYYIHRERVQAFWQQLRSAGAISGKDAPSNLQKKWSYLAPIFAELDYIEVMKMSDDYSSLVNHPRIGLRYRRPVEGPAAPNTVETSQMDLFSSGSNDLE
jgi:O-acetyl-ADP-ribose deacetylase (regulator of RNase III)